MERTYGSGAECAGRCLHKQTTTPWALCRFCIHRLEPKRLTATSGTAPQECRGGESCHE